MRMYIFCNECLYILLNLLIDGFGIMYVCLWWGYVAMIGIGGAGFEFVRLVRGLLGSTQYYYFL